jgi:hypothetical protein
MTRYLVWSNEHQGYWRGAAWGYTEVRRLAYRYTLEEATRICLKANKYLKESAVPNEVIVPIDE